MSGSTIIASASVLGLLLWSVAPVCGAPADLDPESCCERSASCNQMAGDPVNASDCCSVDEHGQAAATLSSTVSIVPASLDTESLDTLDEPGASAEANGFVGIHLEGHGPPLYVLTHNYRI